MDERLALIVNSLEELVVGSQDIVDIASVKTDP